jgi:hypothetical protein
MLALAARGVPLPVIAAAAGSQLTDFDVVAACLPRPDDATVAAWLALDAARRPPPSP